VQLVAVSTVANSKALLKSAIRSDNPIIFFEHVLLYNVKGGCAILPHRRLCCTAASGGGAAAGAVPAAPLPAPLCCAVNGLCAGDIGASTARRCVWRWQHSAILPVAPAFPVAISQAASQAGRQ
jgi:hypothetical protein